MFEFSQQISLTHDDVDIAGRSRSVVDEPPVSQPETGQSPKHGCFARRIWTRIRSKPAQNTVTFRSLMRYARRIDVVCMFVATIAAAGHGAAQPLLILVFGNFVQTLIDSQTVLCTVNITALTQQHCPPAIEAKSMDWRSTQPLCNSTLKNLAETHLDLRSAGRHQPLYVVAMGCGVILLGYIQITLWNIVAHRQVHVIRQRLFRSILQKDIAYFDEHPAGELTTYLTDNVNQIQNGIGDKLGLGVKYLASFISGLTIGLAKGWKLALVVVAFSPMLITVAILFSKLAVSLTTMESKAYSGAGAIAEEVISSIRTVFAFNGQEREKRRYEKQLNEARRSAIRRGMIAGVAGGFMWLVVYCGYALGFWYGTKLVHEGEYGIGQVFIIFFAVTHAVFDLGQASTQFQTLMDARTAAFTVWQVIDTSSKLINDGDVGLKKDQLIGDVQFANVHFHYPSQPDQPILKGLSFEVKRGQTIALVGSSGSGKSTCIQLLQRLYDPESGAINLDGSPLKAYNLKWLRSHIGVVSQEPVLFHATIRENILLGRESATDEEIHEAAKMANAHSFIMTLPEKYNTLVGERGSALSGGQKQRIAIARALIRNPTILILDEATSALDNESEKLVQDALDRATEGRTTLIIAHRLSTIENADKIVVIHKGEVVEEGNHQSLMDAKGMYYGLVEQQNVLQAEYEHGQELERQESIRSAEAECSEQRMKVEWVRALSTISRGMSVLDPALLQQLEQIHPPQVDEKQEKFSNMTWTMFKLNKPEWLFVVFGCLASLCSGGLQPVFSIVLSKLIAVFQECDRSEQEKQVHKYVILFVVVGVLRFVAMFFQSYLFGYSGAALTRRLRAKMFRSILRQEIAYFDHPSNTTGTLCARLATEASDVQGATGAVGLILQNLSSLGLGILISFAFSWQMTLVVLAFLPIIVIGGKIQSRLTTRLKANAAKSVEEAEKVSMQSIQNIRTVVSLACEDHCYDEYIAILNTPYRASLRWTHAFAFLTALVDATAFFCWAALFALTVSLMSDNKISFSDGLLVFNCVVFGVQGLTRTTLLSADYGRAKQATREILTLLARKPSIDNESDNGDEIEDFRGSLQFNDVYFIYPSRPDAIILKNFKLSIEPGQKVALVGTSGCGKSTSIQLMERFYDASLGQLYVDSKDVRTLNLHWYRSQLGIVSQEPVLFDMSIRENIAYGDNSRCNIPIEDIIRAAQDANIHDFIQQLPQGYETNCGAKGSQLSGGQKQRIAIARALLRNPKILLLDEATSALDSESEKVVQDALERAQQSRTSIVIAHRLSTIQNADVICVMHKGCLVEQGTHEELLAQKGRYHRLVHGKLN